MRRTATRLLGGLVALTLLVPAGQAAAQDLEWRIAPYFWLAGLDGEVGKGPLTVPVDLSFGDIFEQVEFAALGHLEVGKDKWAIGADVVYMGIGADVTVQRPALPTIDGSLDVDFFQLEGLFIYDVYGETGGVEVLGGVRYTGIDTDIVFEGVDDFGLVSGNNGWVDPFVGIRVGTDQSQPFFASARIDVGGFGISSDLAWNNLALLGYRFSDLFSMAGGFRYLLIDYDNGKQGAESFKWDVDQFGFLFGFAFDL